MWPSCILLIRGHYCTWSTQFPGKLTPGHVLQKTQENWDSHGQATLVSWYHTLLKILVHFAFPFVSWHLLLAAGPQVLYRTLQLDHKLKTFFLRYWQWEVWQTISITVFSALPQVSFVISVSHVCQWHACNMRFHFWKIHISLSFPVGCTY